VKTFSVHAPDALQLALLLGLVAHKGLWEALKHRRAPSARARRVRGSVRLLKLAKIGTLVFLVAQTLFLQVLPIARDPAALRVVGCTLFVLGMAMAMSARVQLGRNWLDIEDLAVRPDQSLVDRGIYRFVRHPIYTGDLLLLLGLEIALNSWLVLAVAPLVAIVVRRSRMEEALLSERLAGYRAYRMRTKRFVPFVV
jgi:protein-S-isoprenylcysteine O-methyltransferase Ste14